MLVAALALLAVIGSGLLLWYRMPMHNRLVWASYRAALFSDAPVLAIGDSIAFQAVPESLCGDKVLNAAIPGDQLADLLHRAPLLIRLVQPRRVVVAIGVNDSGFGHMAVDDWAARYRALLGYFPASSLVLVEVNPVDLAHPGYVPLHDRDFIARQNVAIRALAREFGASVVPAPAPGHTMDGLHPDATGVGLWQQRLAAAACSG